MSMKPDEPAPARNWRPAMFRSPDGARGRLANAWELLDGVGQRVARITLEEEGAEAGRWRWLVLVHPHGAPLGESGVSDTAAAARRICEQKVPDWTIARLPQGRRRRMW